MTAYSFQSQFVAPILAGTKRQTIRAERKRHARPGEAMQLYTGMRTKQCRLIGRAICIDATPIRIDVECGIVIIDGDGHMGTGYLNDFARHDGFDDWLDMRTFWQRHHGETNVFSGVLIRWTNFVSGDTGVGEDG